MECNFCSMFVYELCFPPFVDRIGAETHVSMTSEKSICSNALQNSTTRGMAAVWYGGNSTTTLARNLNLWYSPFYDMKHVPLQAYLTGIVII
jgi:hypothetical protein